MQTLATRWALEHGVSYIAHNPHWQACGRAAGFERNDATVRAAALCCGRMILIAEHRLLNTDDGAFRPWTR